MSSSSSDEGSFYLTRDHFKIVVLGEPGCGKTSFIRSYYDNNSPADAYSFNNAKVYPCKIEIQNVSRNIELLEFLGDSQLTPEEKKFLFFHAHAIVLMYAIDDPSSFQAVVDKWLDEIAEKVENCVWNLIIVGNKSDLRIDQQVIERLARNNETPLTPQQVRDQFRDPDMKEFVTFLECSTKNDQSVLRTVRKIILEIYERVKNVEEFDRAFGRGISGI